MAAPPYCERRPIAGTSVDTSVLGLVVDPPPSATPVVDLSLVTLLQRIRRSGVTTFDLSRARSVPRAIRLLLTAFPGGDTEILIILGLAGHPRDAGPPYPRTPPTPSFSDREEDLRKSTVELAGRFTRFGSVFVDWDSSSTRPELFDGTSAWLNTLVERGTLGGWSLRARPGEELPIPPGVLSVSPVSVELSLLDLRALAPLVRRYAQRRGGVLVRNPFADGRLDGTRFSTALSDRSPVAPPVDVRSLHQEFAPVLRLGSLTRAHRRTLAQASLQYLLQWPWVSTVLLPLPAPERWDEIRATLSAPALDDRDLKELGLVPGSRASAGIPPGPDI